MDYVAALRELNLERERLTRLITVLEEVAAGLKPTRRGRKSMSAEEREEVSRRMKRYWAKRKQAENEGVE